MANLHGRHLTEGVPTSLAVFWSLVLFSTVGIRAVFIGAAGDCSVLWCGTLATWWTLWAVLPLEVLLLTSEAIYWGVRKYQESLRVKQCECKRSARSRGVHHNMQSMA